MARDISELGADVFDDTVVQNKHHLSPKARNYIIGLSVTGVLLVGLVIGVVVLCNTALTDYSNVRNVKYFYTPAALVKDGEKPTATLYQLDSDKKYPSTFRVPSQVRGYKVTAIGDNAFAGHDEIKRVIIPNTVETIGERAFYNCKNLAKFTFSKNISYVGTDAFLNTKFFADISSDSSKPYTLPSGILIYVSNDYFKPNTALISDGVSDAEINDIKTKYGAAIITKFSELKIKSMASGAFRNNDKIVYLDLPSGINTLPISIFEGCKNLKGFDSTNSSITTIADYAFKGCKSLKDIHFSEGITSIGKEAFANTGLVDTIPDISKVETFGESVFANCSSLTTVTYPTTTVPNKMFANCSSLEEIKWGEGNVLMDRVTTLGYGAFSGTGFKEFVIPKNVTQISDELFMDSKELETVHVYGNPNDKLVEGSDAEDSKETYINDAGETKKGTLLGVTQVRTRAFKGCEKLKTIATYKDDGSTLKLEAGVFNLPKSLKSTNASSTQEDNISFQGTAATKIVVNNNLANIGKYCFSEMSNLQEVVLPEQGCLATILGNAFENDRNLEKINLVSSITTIGASAFKNCEKIEELDLGTTSITSVASEVFYNCDGIETIVIPNTATTIKKHAFYKNASLKKVYISEKVSSINEAAFVTDSDRSEPLEIYVSRKYNDDIIKNNINFASKKEGGKVVSWTWYDENCKVYYLNDETPVEGINYWDGVIPNP